MASRQLLHASRSLLRPTPVTSQRIEKWGQPFRVILLDYVDVSKDLFTSAKRQPIKSLLYLLTGGLIVALWRRRPDQTHLVSSILEYSNEMAMVSRPLRNPQSQAYIDTLMALLVSDELYCVNFGLFSIAMRRLATPECQNYHVTCKHLQPHVWTVGERLVDVGVWGTWVELERRMADFDVNEEQLELSLDSRE